MAYFNRYTTSLYGRRMGLQQLSSNAFGASVRREVLVGPEDIRKETSTAETTSSNLRAFGFSQLVNSSAGSSQVWTIDPPIMGIQKTVTFLTTVNTQYLKGASGETFESTQGTSNTTLKSTQLTMATLILTPISTARWMVTGQLSSAFVAASTST